VTKEKISALLCKSGLLLVGVPFGAAIFYSAGYAALIGLGFAHEPERGDALLKNFLEQFAVHLISVGMCCMLVGCLVGYLVGRKKVNSKSA
jgi:uncharacterized protein YjeT (DUF2065 family)